MLMFMLFFNNCVIDVTKVCSCAGVAGSDYKSGNDYKTVPDYRSTAPDVHGNDEPLYQPIPGPLVLGDRYVAHIVGGLVCGT